MAKWVLTNVQSKELNEALNELLRDDVLTFAPDETGAMAFYRGNECVGRVPASRRIALVQDLVRMLPR